MRKGYASDKLNQMHSTGYYNYLCSAEFEPVYQYIADHFIKNNCNHIADIGCWNGMFYKVLKASGYSNKYYGFDLSDGAINEAIEKYSNDNAVFETRSWDDPGSKKDCDGIYFGGVFYYIKEKAEFINKFIDAYNPRIISIQDLQSTDLSFVDHMFDTVETRKFKVDLKINEPRKLRQVKIIRLK